MLVFTNILLYSAIRHGLSHPQFQSITTTYAPVILSVIGESRLTLAVVGIMMPINLWVHLGYLLETQQKCLNTRNTVIIRLISCAILSDITRLTKVIWSHVNRDKTGKQTTFITKLIAHTFVLLSCPNQWLIIIIPYSIMIMSWGTHIPSIVEIEIGQLQTHEIIERM